jgi:hypothetical protein
MLDLPHQIPGRAAALAAGRNWAIHILAETTELVAELASGTTLHSGLATGQFAILAVMLLATVSLVSLYPA